MTLWHKKQNHYPPRWICITHISYPTLFPRGISIFQGILAKFNFLTKFPHLEKFINLMKNLKYKHQSIFPLWGRVKLNLRDRKENQTIIFNRCIIFEKQSRKEKYLSKKIVRKKTCWKNNFCQKKICKKNFLGKIFCWKNFCQKKNSLGKQFL